MGVTLCSLTVKIKTKDLMQSWGDGSSVYVIVKLTEVFPVLFFLFFD